MAYSAVETEGDEHEHEDDGPKGRAGQSCNGFGIGDKDKAWA